MPFIREKYLKGAIAKKNGSKPEHLSEQHIRDIRDIAYIHRSIYKSVNTRIAYFLHRQNFGYEVILEWAQPNYTRTEFLTSLQNFYLAQVVLAQQILIRDLPEIWVVMSPMLLLLLSISSLVLLVCQVSIKP